ELDSLKKYNNSKFLATKFRNIKEHLRLVDSMAYNPYIYSSELLWKWNLFAMQRKLPVVPDIWILYKKE
ncbi:MAG TPA: hypothetical protein VM368_07205, partial [Flavisolibacter sp.]|nr:hypothetical protein [Flavisolibacter sp.]